MHSKLWRWFFHCWWNLLWRWNLLSDWGYSNSKLIKAIVFIIFIFCFTCIIYMKQQYHCIMQSLRVVYCQCIFGNIHFFYIALAFIAVGSIIIHKFQIEIWSVYWQVKHVVSQILFCLILKQKSQNFAWVSCTNLTRTIWTLCSWLNDWHLMYFVLWSASWGPLTWTCTCRIYWHDFCIFLYVMFGTKVHLKKWPQIHIANVWLHFQGCYYFYLQLFSITILFYF
jgi:hypothetical protein